MYTEKLFEFLEGAGAPLEILQIADRLAHHHHPERVPIIWTAKTTLDAKVGYAEAAVAPCICTRRYIECLRDLEHTHLFRSYAEALVEDLADNERRLKRRLQSLLKERNSVPS